MVVASKFSLSMHCGIVEEKSEIYIIINVTLFACFFWKNQKSVDEPNQR